MASFYDPLDLSTKGRFNTVVLQVDGSYPSFLQRDFAELSRFANDSASAQPLDLRVDRRVDSSSTNTEDEVMFSKGRNDYISGEFTFTVLSRASKL